MKTKIVRVFIVTTGQYDSYRIISIFSTRYRAKKFIRNHPDRDLVIENWQLNKPEPDMI